MAARRPATRTTKTTTRETKVTSRKAADAPVVVDDAKGMTFNDGLVIVTTLLLLTAIVLTDYLLGKHFGSGLFFKK